MLALLKQKEEHVEDAKSQLIRECNRLIDALRTGLEMIAKFWPEEASLLRKKLKEL